MCIGVTAGHPGLARFEKGRWVDDDGSILVRDGTGTVPVMRRGVVFHPQESTSLSVEGVPK
jgi:hypothetical protein